MQLPRRKRRDLGTFVRYAATLVGRFRWTIGLATLAVALGGFLFWITPHDQLGGRRPDALTALYAAWMAMFAESTLTPPQTWYLALVAGIYPLLGFVLVGEGLLRLSTLLVSRERGEAEWMKVMAKTYRDHTILCGLGHLGHRVLEQLVAAEVDVVAVEADASCRFITEARRVGIPILLRDMRDDQTLVDAGIAHARCIVVATNTDMANAEVAIDARRLNPKIRIVMRMFDQTIADKMKGVLQIDHAFSSAAVAAPVVAAYATGTGVLTAYSLRGTLVETAEFAVVDKSPYRGRAVQYIERDHGIRITWLIREGKPPELAKHDDTVSVGDRIVVHGRAEELAAFRQATA